MTFTVNKGKSKEQDNIYMVCCSLCKNQKETAQVSSFSYESEVKVKVTQSCPTLCNPMDYTVHGVLQVRILERLDFPFSRGSSQPRDHTQVSHMASRFFTNREALTSCPYEDNNSLMRFPSPWYNLNLCSSQRSCLQIPSRWG